METTDDLRPLTADDYIPHFKLKKSAKKAMERVKNFDIKKSTKTATERIKEFDILLFINICKPSKRTPDASRTQEADVKADSESTTSSRLTLPAIEFTTFKVEELMSTEETQKRVEQ